MYHDFYIYKNVRPNGNLMKIQVIKELRSVLSLGLKEAKDIVDFMDTITGTNSLSYRVNMTKEQALQLKDLGFSIWYASTGKVVTAEEFLPDELFVIE
jgi:hypothetical protein